MSYDTTVEEAQWRVGDASDVLFDAGMLRGTIFVTRLLVVVEMRIC